MIAGQPLGTGLMHYMKSNYNDAMLHLLGGDPSFTEPSSVPIPDGLNQLLGAGFEERNGTTLLRLLAVSRSSLLADLMSRDDETGIETTINELHLEDYLDLEIPLFELARLGCDFAFLLAKGLHDGRPRNRFRVIVSAMDANKPDSVKNTCVVRFHQQRDGQQWLDENLENYRNEAIAVFDV